MASSFISRITVRPIQQVGGDALVIAAARVSTSGPAALSLLAEDPAAHFGLINYLMKQRHGSPFEHGAITFFVHAPLFVFREWMRHRIASYSEESGRYHELKPVFWVPRTTRPLSLGPNYKAARPSFIAATPAQSALIRTHRRLYTQLYRAYRQELRAQIAPEVARRLLPLAIYSSMWVTMNPRALMNFLSLRVHEPGASYLSYPQAEIEEAARQVELLFAAHWPLTHRAFLQNGRVAP